MSPLLLLWTGVLLLLGSASIVYLALGGNAPTGVAKSLALIEAQVSSREVARSEVSASDRLLRPLSDLGHGLASRLTPHGVAERLARNLELAGSPAAWPQDRVLKAKSVALGAGLVLGFFMGGFSARGVLLALGFGVAFFFVPDLLVYNTATKRQSDLRRELADAIDLLTLCVEAGQSFNAAMLQVSRSSDGAIAGEFSRILAEIQIGKSRAEAFTAFGQRTKATEIRTLVTAISQADRLGLPVGGVLREQAKEMRVVRRQVAEAKAQQVPVKILFPMLLFIFPALFIVLMGPGAIQIVDSFKNF